jgi:A-macroglobulin TED domain
MKTVNGKRARKRKNKCFIVRRGSVGVPIYTTRNVVAGVEYLKHEVVWYDADGRRCKLRFSDLGKAKREASRVAVSGNGMMHWTSPGYSLTYSHGSGMDVETTALCTMAMIKAGLWPESVKEALTWITKQKTFNGTWGSTQATILAMRALIAGSSASLGQNFESTVTVLLNGEKVETFHINKDNSDVMKQVGNASSFNAVILHNFNFAAPRNAWRGIHGQTCRPASGFLRPRGPSTTRFDGNGQICASAALLPPA